MFEDEIINEKIPGMVSRIHKTITTHYKYRHIQVLYFQPRTNPLALTMHNKISNFMFDHTSTTVSDSVVKFIIKGRNGTIWTP
jgi:hypothetical protein